MQQKNVAMLASSMKKGSNQPEDLTSNIEQ